MTELKLEMKDEDETKGLFCYFHRFLYSLEALVRPLYRSDPRQMKACLPALIRKLGAINTAARSIANAISSRQFSLAGHELKRQLYQRKREKANRDKMTNKREAHAKERPSEKCDVIKTACLHLTPSDSTRLRNE